MAYIDHTEGERVGGLVGRARDSGGFDRIDDKFDYTPFTKLTKHIWQIGSEDVCKSVRSASGAPVSRAAPTAGRDQVA